MPIRELYYTSSHPKHAANAGFQVKAQSPGITAAQMRVLNKAMGYKIPQSQVTEPIATHPVALRYVPFDAQTAVLLCSQSAGADENMRPGNYFAHCVLGEMNLISKDDQLPPIVFWGSSFWQHHDDDPRETLESLPISDTFAAQWSFNFDAAWPFLQEGNRLKWYRQMLATLINTERKIVIRDRIEHVVIWIYALSLPLPPRLRNLLSFSTYHHDPLNAPFRVSGVVPEQSMRPGDYFLLDAPELTVSDAPPSSFADYVADHMTETGFNEVLLPLIDALQNRLRNIDTIPRSVDALTDFFLTEKQGRLAHDWSRLLASAAAVVQTLPATPSPHDTDDVQAAWHLAGDALKHIQTPAAIETYLAALHAAKRHPLPPDTIYPVAAAHAGAAFTAGHRAALPAIARIIKADQQQAAFNHSDALRVIELRTLADAQLFWDTYGPALSFSGNTHHLLNPLLNRTLDLLDAEAGANPLDVSSDGARLVATLVLATGEDRQYVLNQANQWTQATGKQHAFFWLYYALVEKLNIQRRATEFWPRYWNQFPDLHRYELRRDRAMLKSTDDIADHLLRWLNALKDTDWRTKVLVHALEDLYGSVQQDRLAQRLLADDHVTRHLPKEWYERLLSDGLMGVLIARPDADTVAAYEKFVREVPINDFYLAVMEGSLAIHTRTLHPATVDHLRSRFRQLEDDRVYEQEMLALAEVFFVAATHEPFIAATYVLEKRVVFWNVYWSLLKAVLEHGDIAGMVGILNFWFAGAGPLYTASAYVVPEFFSQLGTVFSEWLNHRNLRPQLTALDEACQHEQWYDVLAPLLTKGGRRGLFGGLLG